MKSARLSRRKIMLVAGSGATAASLAYLWQTQFAGDFPRGSPLPVDLTDLAVGKLLTLDWQDKPVWILRRPAAELAALAGRVFRVGPAPAKLVIPAYHFESANRLVLGSTA